jgi:hypothetical protein
VNKTLIIIIAGAIIVICCAGAVIVGLVAMSSDGSTSSVARPDVSPTPIPPAPSFEEIRQQHDATTEAQWKQYRSQIEGTQVIGWRGWVDEVTGNPGRYRVRIDMDAPGEIFEGFSEIDFIIPDDVALNLQIGQAVTFSGQIETAQDFMGELDITLEHAELLQ